MKVLGLAEACAAFGITQTFRSLVRIESESREGAVLYIRQIKVRRPISKSTTVLSVAIPKSETSNFFSAKVPKISNKSGSLT